MKHAKKEFKGSILYISLSPHGDPEGVVLEDGSFIKAPPHSLVAKELFKVGAMVTGEGELLVESPNRVFHHVVIKSGSKVMSDDSGSKDDREDLKEKHKADLKTRKDAKDEPLVLKGKLVAIATKPKGEVDRFIFEDGTSVHISKEIELDADDCELGAMFEVKGKARNYGTSRFLKADSVKAL
jgi:hypothetical protein